MQMKRCDTHRRSSFYITHPLFATRNDKVLCLRLTAFVEGPVGVLSHTGPTADTFCCSECVFGFVCGRTWSLSIFLFFVCMQQYRGVKAVSICETHCICAGALQWVASFLLVSCSSTEPPQSSHMIQWSMRTSGGAFHTLLTPLFNTASVCRHSRLQLQRRPLCHLFYSLDYSISHSRPHSSLLTCLLAYLSTRRPQQM